MNERLSRLGIERSRFGAGSELAGAVGLLAIGTYTLSTALANAPLPGGVPLSGPVPTKPVLALLALAALALLADAGTPLRATILSIASVFGALAAAFEGAVPVAVAALAVCGVALAVTERSPLSVAVLGVIAGGLVVSLLAVSGVTPSARAGGTWLFCLGLAGLVAITTPARIDWLAGACVAAGVLLVGMTAPFVSGAVLLVAGGVVGAPLALVALAVGGVAAAVAATVRAGDRRRALGSGVLLLGGVPASPPAALAAVVGLALLTEGSR